MWKQVCALGIICRGVSFFGNIGWTSLYILSTNMRMISTHETVLMSLKFTVTLNTKVSDNGHSAYTTSIEQMNEQMSIQWAKINRQELPRLEFYLNFPPQSCWETAILLLQFHYFLHPFLLFRPEKEIVTNLGTVTDLKITLIPLNNCSQTFYRIEGCL